MRVAIVHSYYSNRQPSGENAVVDAQAAALRDAGHDVEIIGQHTDALEQKRGYSTRAAWNVATGGGPSPTAALERFRPDVVHVHNLFPNWGTRWLDGWRGPLVATMHNFRPACAAGTLYREGSTCMLCPSHGSLNAVKHACYRGSRVASLPLAIRNRHGVTGDAVLGRADRVILLSERARALYLEFGLDEEKSSVVPNFVRDHGFSPRAPLGERWAYIGRLTEEKGIRSLLAYWPASVGLDVYGDGPLRDEVESAGEQIRYHGSIPRADVADVLARSCGLVIPSEWAEGFPTTYIEALAAARPVVAREGNSAADDVSASKTGVTYGKPQDLPGALERAREVAQAIGIRARARFEVAYTRQSWVEHVTALYRSAYSV